MRFDKNIILIFYFWIGCADSSDVDIMENNKTSYGSDENIIGVGYIKFSDLEGGYYELITSDNKVFDVHDLPEVYKINGIIVKFSGIIRAESVCVHAGAPTLELKSIEKLKY